MSIVQQEAEAVSQRISMLEDRLEFFISRANGLEAGLHEIRRFVADAMAEDQHPSRGTLYAIARIAARVIEDET